MHTDSLKSLASSSTQIHQPFATIPLLQEGEHTSCTRYSSPEAAVVATKQLHFFPFIPQAGSPGSPYLGWGQDLGQRAHVILKLFANLDLTPAIRSIWTPLTSMKELHKGTRIRGLKLTYQVIPQGLLWSLLK